MTMRITETTITFRRPFHLTALDCLQPAGTYRLVTDEILDLSSRAYRRTATMLHTPAVSVHFSDWKQAFLVDPSELAAAFEADGRA